MASESLQEVMGSIREDPRVLSLLSKKRGQTGVRDLQGESLRANLDAVHGMLVCITLSLGSMDILAMRCTIRVA